MNALGLLRTVLAAAEPGLPADHATQELRELLWRQPGNTLTFHAGTYAVQLNCRRGNETIRVTVTGGSKQDVVVPFTFVNIDDTTALIYGKLRGDRPLVFKPETPGVPALIRGIAGTALKHVRSELRKARRAQAAAEPQPTTDHNDPGDYLVELFAKPPRVHVSGVTLQFGKTPRGFFNTWYVDVLGTHRRRYTIGYSHVSHTTWLEDATAPSRFVANLPDMTSDRTRFIKAVAAAVLKDMQVTAATEPRSGVESAVNQLRQQLHTRTNHTPQYTLPVNAGEYRVLFMSLPGDHAVRVHVIPRQGPGLSRFTLDNLGVHCVLHDFTNGFESMKVRPDNSGVPALLRAATKLAVERARAHIKKAGT